MSVLDKLTHTINIHPLSSTPSATGELGFSTPTNGVSCYISRKSRRFIENREEIQTNLEIILGGGVSVEVGWLFTNGQDVKGVTLCNTALVKNVEPISHPVTGMKIKLAQAIEI